jgi:glycosyltransferase involved in cell wall biosynthesis
MDRTRAALVVSTPAPPTPALGRENYSYSFAVRQFRPLLARWGQTREVDRPESRVEFSVRRFRQGGLEPVHLGFSPLHAAYFARDARNAAFVFWEYPDLPDPAGAADARYDWAAVANRHDRLLTASTFARDAFRRAGVTTPIEVVPVPVSPEWFGVPDWRPGARAELDLPSYDPAADGPPPGAPAAAREPLAARLKRAYRNYVKPLLPAPLLRRLQSAHSSLLVPHVGGVPVPVPCRPRLDLSGVVYLHLCNPYDRRKNWQDLLAAFIEGLGDRDDAVLVFKLAADGALLPHAVNEVNTFYRDLGRAHRCRIAMVGGFLGDAQMLQLVGATTYYATATRAEGANLPLMDALAAGRPALSPAHTSMADYHGPELGWVVPSEEEPAAVAVGTERVVSSWHRVDAAALAAQFRESYEVARGDPGRYRAMAGAARRRMREYASAERVWPRLREALDAAAGGDS